MGLVGIHLSSRMVSLFPPGRGGQWSFSLWVSLFILPGSGPGPSQSPASCTGGSLHPHLCPHLPISRPDFSHTKSTEGPLPAASGSLCVVLFSSVSHLPSASASLPSSLSRLEPCALGQRGCGGPSIAPEASFVRPEHQ